MDPMIGKTIDDTYQITSVLGVGGMGVVYKARDVMLEKDVAIKMMDVRLANDADFLKRFQQEAKALAKLQDPNTVAIYTLKKTDVGFCIVMEFVDGCTLADVLKEAGVLPLQRTKQIFRQILRAFSYAHSRGIVHRDIKPSNVMLTAEDFVKITDFGLAKIQQPSGATQTMGTGGTLFYMSPEQVRGLANVDLRGDIYSLGMTLYEAVTGRLPFSDTDSDFDIREAIVHGKIKSPVDFRKDLPADLVKVITKAIDKDPEKRFQSASEMLEALDKVVVGSATDSPNRGGNSGSSRRTSPVNKSTIIVAALGVAGALYSGLFKGSADTTLSVISNPPDVGILFGDSVMGNTPLNQVRLNPGIRKIRATKQGYIPLDTNLYLKAGVSNEVVLTLTKAPPTSISLRSEPSSARVVLNGTVIGITPLEKYAVAAGIFKLRLEHDAYRPKEVDLVVYEGQDTSVNVRMEAAQATSQLVLGVVPAGSITVDGKAQSAGTIGVTAGSHTLVFTHPQYGSKTITVDIQEGQSKRFTCYFEASISVNAQPVFGYIWVDGKNTGIQTPAEYTLPPGKHKVTVKRSGYRAAEGEREVDVTPVMSKRVVDMAFTLVPN